MSVFNKTNIRTNPYFRGDGRGNLLSDVGSSGECGIEWVAVGRMFQELEINRKMPFCVPVVIISVRRVVRGYH